MSDMKSIGNNSTFPHEDGMKLQVERRKKEKQNKEYVSYFESHGKAPKVSDMYKKLKISKENVLDEIDKILSYGDAFLITSESNFKVIDYRLKTIRNLISSLEETSDEFYKRLIEIIAKNLNKLFDKSLRGDISIDSEGNFLKKDVPKYIGRYQVALWEADKNLAEHLYELVCLILKRRKDIVLDFETTQKLLDRVPEENQLIAELIYDYRSLDFEKLANILVENKAFEKMNLSLNEKYKLLIDTCQINNQEIFPLFISSDEFIKDHTMVDDFLSHCNTKIFVEITDIIIEKIDSNYDRLSILKKKEPKKDYIEGVLFDLLKWQKEKSLSFASEIMADSNFNINYDSLFSDYFGTADLKSEIAHKGNPELIKRMLSIPSNVEEYYFHGEARMNLECLYAMIGEFENAVSTFENEYQYQYDYSEDFNHTLKTVGKDEFELNGVTDGDWDFKDSLVELIRYLRIYLERHNVSEEEKMNYITRILNSKGVKYINLSLVVYIKEILSNDNFQIILKDLKERYENGLINFLVTEESFKGLFNKYEIRLATKEEITEKVLSYIEKPNQLVRK